MPTNRAAVLYAPHDLRIEERPLRALAVDEVLLRVETVGICGSDLGEFDHGPVLTPLTAPHPITGQHGSIVLGHEFSGRVAEVGDGVEDLEPGRLVASGSGVWCGECWYCTRGRLNMCERYWTVGFHHDGALAEHVVVPRKALLPVDETVFSADAAALIQPMSIAVHSMRRGRPEAGQRVAVVGAGGVGAFLIAALRATGVVEDVLVVEPDEGRRALALELGATRAVSSPEGEPGRDVVYEVSGSAAGLGTATTLVRRTGTLVMVGIQSAPADPAFLRRVTLDELNIVGPNAHVFVDDFADAAAIIAARRDWTLIAPRVIAIARAAQRFGGHGSDWPVKTLLSPGVGHERPAQY